MIAAKIDPVSTYARMQPGAPACADLESGTALDLCRARPRRRPHRRLAGAEARTGQRRADRDDSRATAPRCWCCSSPRSAPARSSCRSTGGSPRPSSSRSSRTPSRVLLFADDGFAATAAATAAAAARPSWSSTSPSWCRTRAAGAAARTRRRDWESAGHPALHVGDERPAEGRDPDRGQRLFRLHQLHLRQRCRPEQRVPVRHADVPHRRPVRRLRCTPIHAGGSVLISRGFDAPGDARAARRSGARRHPLFLGAANGAGLWQAAGLRPGEAARHILTWATGGAPNPAAQVERFVRAGINMSNGFGMSETGSNFGMPMDDPDRLIAKAGCCGLPYACGRGEDGRRGGRGPAARRHRRIVDRRPERHAGLLEPAGGE